MSEIRVDSITDEQGTGRPAFSNGVQTSNINGGQVGGRRNLIINGAMQVAQRGTSVTSNGSGYLVVDRFTYYFGNGNSQTTFDVEQSSDSPEKFSNSLKIAVNTIGDTSPVTMSQSVEGQNISHLSTGTPNARTMTLSFFVKSNVVGTYAIEFKAHSETEFYRYVGNYTIDESGIWEAKQIVVLPLTEISVRNTNDVGLGLEFWLNDRNGDFSGDNTALENWVDASTMGSSARAAGQTATIGDSANDYWQITGVQLEVGDTATEFEHRSYGEELALCQRYFYRFDTSNLDAHPMWAYQTNDSSTRLPFPTTMRVQPSVSIEGSTTSSSDWNVYNDGSFRGIENISISKVSTDSLRLNVESTSGVNGSDALGLYARSSNAGLTADAEL